MLPTMSNLGGIQQQQQQTTSQLAEFASSMVYLMWHARKATKQLQQSSPIGNSDFAFLMWQSRKPSSGGGYSPLGDLYSNNSAIYSASPAFKKFCFQVLTATQLQESAVYLSLKYIAILLQSNPTIEGAEGSEYRLFIVALMLANKFLDDNTFTNKTWSDVSGMKIVDLNIMESEFLEALDYNLFVRQHEFNIWKNLLEECRDRATRMSCSTTFMYDHNQQQQQRQQLILLTLQTLGLYGSSEKTLSSPIDSYVQPHTQPQHYQHFPTSSTTTTSSYNNQLPYSMQAPVGYNNSYYNNNNALGIYPITNLSQSSWDPLAYSLNRGCQDYSYYSTSSQNYFTSARPISWRNFS